MTDEHNQQLRFARIRRAKFWLRFMPRRARFHTYPVVGRFAAFARKRSYLWSFSYPQIRPALYSGSVLTLLPLPGQLPIAFGLCLIFRTNLMILGGLQFASNILTFPFILTATYQIGDRIMRLIGIEKVATLPADAGANAVAPALAEQGFASKFFHYSSAFTIGGIILGLALGAVLDLLWRWLVLPAARHHAAKKPVTAVVTPHDHASSSPPFPPSDSSS